MISFIQFSLSEFNYALFLVSIIVYWAIFLVFRKRLVNKIITYYMIVLILLTIIFVAMTILKFQH